MSTSVRRVRTGVVSEGDKSKREEGVPEEKTQEPDMSKKVREEVPSPVKEKEAFNSFKAHSMSMDYNLPGGHVTQAWKLFKRYDANDDDLLSPYEFQLLLRTVLRERYPRAKDVPRELFKELQRDHDRLREEAIEIQQTQISVTFEDFLTWITRNAFQECLLLTDEQRFIRLVARRFYVSVPDVEKAVKRRFDSFCQANPGHLEYQEFCQLIALLLNLRDTTALPESRVKSFWRELDDNGKGSVDFTEFIPWYLGYFGNGPGLEVFQDPRPQQMQSGIDLKEDSVAVAVAHTTSLGRRAHESNRRVSVHERIVNLYGQLLPGRPADDAPAGGWPGTGRFVSANEAAEDTRSARFRWFEAGLASLARAVPSSCSLALPTRIGCGLAGGRWPQYLAALKRFCEENRNLSVVLYDIEGSEATGYEAAPAAAAAPSVPRPRATPVGSSGTSAFWSSATFEVLRDGQWTPYPQARQEELRAALLREDDCLEVLVDAERRTALTTLQELGACPRSLGGGVESSAASLVVRWDDGEGPVEVNLASIVSLAALSEERSPKGTTRVRLHLPAVREGELRLPADLDHSTAPEAQSCGRRIDPAELPQQSSGCRICLGDFSHSKRPSASQQVIELFCGHAFHEACLNRWFEESRRCPTCKRRFGHLVGNQPGVGSMSWRLDSRLRLAGHPDSFTIVMNFRFPGGRDAKGEPFAGRSQQAFLPHDEQGKLLLALFQLAFRRRVMFDLRVSATDEKYWPAFNIHLKTALSGGPERFGFPDESYSQRVLEELRQNGVTVAEL
ncbi:DTX3 [Symbiodinium sp. CCMP2592]|nr:DTX3 [Symbiodinium sp. CCMP2592]